MDAETPAQSKDFVGSLARGLAVIDAFGESAPQMTLTEVAARAGLSRAAARRFLLTLNALGYVASDGKQFRLTPKVLGLGYAYLSSLDLWQVAQPFMERVVEAVQESCSASVLDGDEVVYVARVPTKRIMSVGLSIGARLPAHATSMGRVLLAALPDAERDRFLREARLEAHTPHTVTDSARLGEILDAVARQGYAMVDEELEEGLRSIAVPIRNRSGRVLAALNVSGHASRVTSAEMERDFLPVLTAAARDITSALAD